MTGILAVLVLPICCKMKFIWEANNISLSLSKAHLGEFLRY